jgi:peptidoglycan hydrolase-like protein with peptidoglycan-binding domain
MRNVTTTILVIVSFIGILFLVETAQTYDSKVYQLQKKLKDLGYDPSLPDGILGKKTKEALRHFQRDNGLPLTGKIDELIKAELSILKPVSQLSLTEAVKTNDIDKVKALLAAGADVNAENEAGLTPLNVASQKGLLGHSGDTADSQNSRIRRRHLI